MKFEKFSCKRDGLTINGLFCRPEKKNGRLPAAVISHGFGGNYNTTKKYAADFAEMGFAAFVFDFNGGGFDCHSEGRTEDMSVLTEKEDLKAVIEAVCTMSFVDPDDITLAGCSQGGFVSALTAAELKDRITGLILFYPALCIPDDARKGKMILARFDPENIPETFHCGLMKLGRRYAADVMQMNAFEEIRDYTGPVLIIHGSEDQIVDSSYAEEAYRNYLQTHGGVPSRNCQLVMIDGADHGFTGIHGKEWDDYAVFAIQKFLQGKALYFNVDVNLTAREEEKLPEGRGKKLKLYFEGHSESGFFEGDVETPAYDEQIFYGIQPDTCCASYCLKGKDYEGKPCMVHITNRMFSGKKDWVKGWKPTVRTDSEALSAVNTLKCETYAQARKKGPFIHIWA